MIVADERLHPGGQYFKPLAPSHQADPSTLDRQFRDGAILRQSALLAGVRILNEATVWAAFSPHEVAAIVAGRSTLFRPRRLVLATGAYEQSLPVPGWTLPGVMTVGGLQTLARSYRVAPGQRIVVAGNGPLCLQTAAELLDGGANVVAVLEAAGRARPCPHGAILLAAASAEPGLLIEGLAPRRRGCSGLLHWRPPGDAPGGRGARAAGRGGRSRRSTPTSWRWATASPPRRSWRARWAAPIASCRAAAARWRR